MSIPLKSRQVRSWQPVLFQDDSPIPFSLLSQPCCGKCSPCSLCIPGLAQSGTTPLFSLLPNSLDGFHWLKQRPIFSRHLSPLAVFSKAPGIHSASSSASPPDPPSSSLFPVVLQLLDPRGLLSPGKQGSSPTFFLWFYKINNHFPVDVRCNVKSPSENHIQSRD